MSVICFKKEPVWEGTGMCVRGGQDEESMEKTQFSRR